MGSGTIVPLPPYSTGEECIIWLLRQILAQLINASNLNVNIGDKFEWKDGVVIKK